MSKPRIILVSNRVAIPKEPPERFLVLPWGEFQSRVLEGGETPTKVDAETYAMILNAHKKRGIDTPIDFDHQTIDPEFVANGKPPLILGHIANFEMVSTGPEDARGIYAIGTTWTPQGAELVSNMQLRYPSFAGLIRASDGRVMEILSVALTAVPFIDGIKPVMNTKQLTESHMDEIIAWARNFLNLPLTTTNEDVAKGLRDLASKIEAEAGVAANSGGAAILSAIAAMKKARVAVCTAVGVDAAAKDEEIVTAVNSMKETRGVAGNPNPDPTKFAPLSELTAAREEIKSLKKDVLSINRAEFIAAGMKEGRMCVANRASWEERFNKDSADAKEAIKLVPAGTYPADGTVAANTNTAPGVKPDRVTVINRAKIELVNEGGRLICSKRDYINEVLRESGESALTEQESLAMAV